MQDDVIEGVGRGSKPLSGYRIVVDAGNGVGGFYANNVLKPLSLASTISSGTSVAFTPNPATS